MALISGRMTYSSFYLTTFPIGPFLGMLSYSTGGEKVGSWENLLLYHEEPIGSFVWWSVRLGKEPPGQKGLRDTRYLGTRAKDWSGVPEPAGF